MNQILRRLSCLLNDCQDDRIHRLGLEFVFLGNYLYEKNESIFPFQETLFQ